jgi:hypothetical protein
MSMIDDMVAQAVDYCLNDSLPPEQAADKAYVEDDTDTVRYLAVHGLAHLVNAALSRFRTWDADPPGENDGRTGVPRSGNYQFATRPSEAAAAYYWLGKPYGTADGHTRAILDHTLDDMKYNLRRATAQVKAHTNRKALWAIGVEALESRPRVKTVRTLPKTVMAELNDLAHQAFGGAVVV